VRNEGTTKLPQARETRVSSGFTSASGRTSAVVTIAFYKPTYRDEFAPVQNKLNAHLFGEVRVHVAFEDQWMDNSSMADRDLILTVYKNGQRHFSQMAWIKRGRRQASPHRAVLRKSA